MPYVNADTRLPPELVAELQKYAAGELIYVPLPAGSHRSWGLKNGSRARFEARNQQIRTLKAEGVSIEALADRYFLSPDAIRKILYRPSVSTRDSDSVRGGG